MNEKVYRGIRFAIEAIILVFLLLSIMLSIIVSSPFFKKMAYKELNEYVQNNFNMQLSIGELKTDILMRFIIKDITIYQDKDTFLLVNELKIRYSFLPLLYGQFIINKIDVNGIYGNYNARLDSVVSLISVDSHKENNRETTSNISKGFRPDIILKELHIQNIRFDYMDNININGKDIYGTFLMGDKKTGIEIRGDKISLNEFDINTMGGYLWIEDSTMELKDLHLYTAGSDIYAANVNVFGEDIYCSNLLLAISHRDFISLISLGGIEPDSMQLPYWSTFEASMDSFAFSKKDIYTEGNIFVELPEYNNFSADSATLILKNKEIYGYLFNGNYNTNVSFHTMFDINGLYNTIIKLYASDESFFVKTKILFDTMHYQPFNIKNMDIIADSLVYDDVLYTLNAQLKLTDKYVDINKFQLISEEDTLFMKLKGDIVRNNWDIKMNTEYFYLPIQNGGVSIKGNALARYSPNSLYMDMNLQGNLFIDKITINKFGIYGNISAEDKWDNISANMKIMVADIITDTTIIDSLKIVLNGENSEGDLIADIKALNWQGDFVSQWYMDSDKLSINGDSIQVFNTRNGKLFNKDKFLYVYDFKNNIHTIDKFDIYSTGFEMLIDSVYVDKENIQGNMIFNVSDLRRVAVFFAAPFIMKGNGSLSVKLGGSINAPFVNLYMDAHSLRLDHFETDSLYVNIGASRDSIKIKRMDLIKDNHALKLVSKFIPNYDDISRSYVYMSLQCDSVSYKIFDLLRPTVILENGFVCADISLEGTMQSFVSKGSIECENLDLSVPVGGVSVNNAYIHAFLRDDSLIIDSLYGYTENNGYFNGDGFALLKYPDLYYKVNMTGNNLYIYMKDPEIDATANLKGYYEGGIKWGHVKSEVDLIRANLYIPFRSSGAPSMASGKPPYSVTYDIKLNMPNNVWLKNDEANIELTGNLDIKGKDKDIRINGVAGARGGKIYYLDHPFKVERADFKFAGLEKMDPELDILSTSDIIYRHEGKRENIKVYLEVKGTMMHPEFKELYSYPPYDMKDIIALLNFGVLWSDLQGVDDVAGNLSDKAIDYVLRTQVASRIRKTMGLDEVDISSGILTGDKMLNISIGKYVGSNLYLWYRHNILSTFTYDMFKAEYFLGKKASIIGERNEEGKWNLGLLFRWEF